jgi:hypothetical protein
MSFRNTIFKQFGVFFYVILSDQSVLDEIIKNYNELKDQTEGYYLK